MSAQTRTLAIIGSSNSRRIFSPHVAKLTAMSGRKTFVKGATTLATGKKACEELKGDDMAVISFLTNHLVEECSSSTVEELEVKITEVIETYANILKSIPTTVTVIIVYPYPRVQPTWVFEWLTFIHTKLDYHLDRMGSNIHRFPYLAVAKTDYDSDLIHLKQAVCGIQFTDFCVSYGRIFNHESPVINDIEMSPLASGNTITETVDLSQSTDLPPVTSENERPVQWGPSTSD